MRLGARRNARMEPSPTGKKWQLVPAGKRRSGRSYPFAHMRAPPRPPESGAALIEDSTQMPVLHSLRIILAAGAPAISATRSCASRFRPVWLYGGCPLAEDRVGGLWLLL